MGEKTAISWTDHTWNPWVGCHKVSQGCKNCYMFRQQERYGNNPNVIRRTSQATFNAPMKWTGPAMVFTCSWSDFFIEEADDWRNDAYDVMWNSQSLTFQILTKRPERFSRCLPVDWDDRSGWQHVWLGTSVEGQEEIARLGYLLGIDASVRFLSAEPLLGPLDLKDYLPSIDWVIVGGESGPNARTISLDWVRSIRNQCKSHGVPFFFKQVGGTGRDKGGDLLDGRQWHEMPERK